MTLDCIMCHGEGHILESVRGGYYSATSQTFEPLFQERECSACGGSGSVEAPAHENTFNLSPEYAQLKAARAAKRSSTNAFVVAYICGVPIEDLDEAA